MGKQFIAAVTHSCVQSLNLKTNSLVNAFILKLCFPHESGVCVFFCVSLCVFGRGEGGEGSMMGCQLVMV